MRAEALLQLGLWGKTPQRDRVVGIFRPLPARDAKAGANLLMAVLRQGVGQRSGSRAARGARGHRHSAAARSGGTGRHGGRCRRTPEHARRCRDPGQDRSQEDAPEAVRVGALKTLDTFGGDAVLPGIDAAEKSSAAALRLAALQIVARRAPERALPIIRKLTAERIRGRAAGGVRGDGRAQGGRRRRSCWSARSTSSRPARFSPARSSS